MEQRQERSLRVAPCLGKQTGSTAGALTLGDFSLSGIIDYFSLCGVLNGKWVNAPRRDPATPISPGLRRGGARPGRRAALPRFSGLKHPNPF